MKYSGIDNNSTVNTLNPQYYDFRIVNDEIRLYFIKSEANKLQGNITFQMNSWTISNSTTQGWSTANVSLNGSMWTGQNGGSLRLALNSSYYNGLVGFWTGDADSGTIWNNGNNANGSRNTTNQGTWSGNATLNYTTGKIGNAGLFVNNTGRIIIPDSDSLDSVFGTENFTLSAWVNTKDLVQFRGIISKRISNYHSASPGGLYADTAGFRVIMGTGNDAESSINVNYIPNLNQWYHIVGTANGSFLSLYINGSFNNNTPITVNPPPNNDSLTIGSYGSNRDFNGSIDEVMIWNRALSASEISVLYNTSMRTQAMPEIYQQNASAGNVVNQVSINYTGGDSNHNVTILSRTNGTSIWNTVQSNAVSGTWYSINSPANNMDFGIQMNGNGSNTSFISSVGWNETAACNWCGGVNVTVYANGSAKTYSPYGNSEGNMTMSFVQNATNDIYTYNLTTDTTTSRIFNESSNNGSIGIKIIHSNLINNSNYTVKIYWNNGTKFQDFYELTNNTGYLVYNITGFNYSRYTIITKQDPTNPYIVVVIVTIVSIGGVLYILRRYKVI